jgi:O-antigen/teichoic acid export membrane protein
VINVVGNIIVIPHWGINGAATVTLVSEGIAILGVAYVFRRDVGPRIPWAKVLTAPVLVAGTLAAIFYFPLGSSTRGLVLSAAFAICEVAIYFGILYATSNLPEDYAELIGSIRRLPRRAKA